MYTATSSPKTGPNWLRTGLNHNWLRLVLQLLKTAQDCSEPVYVSSVRFFVVCQPLWTGLSPGLVKFGRKTGPDRTSKHYKQRPSNSGMQTCRGLAANLSLDCVCKCGRVVCLYFYVIFTLS